MMRIEMTDCPDENITFQTIYCNFENFIEAQNRATLNQLGP